MKMLSKKEVRTIWQWSESCFHAALYNAISEHVNNIPKNVSLKELKILRLNIDDNEIFRQNLDNDYRIRLCQLTTEQLRLILVAHDQGKIRRAQATIDSILTELLERTLSGNIDSSRSYDDKNEKQSKASKRSRSKKKSRVGRTR